MSQWGDEWEVFASSNTEVMEKVDHQRQTKGVTILQIRGTPWNSVKSFRNPRLGEAAFARANASRFADRPNLRLRTSALPPTWEVHSVSWSSPEQMEG